MLEEVISIFSRGYNTRYAQSLLLFTGIAEQVEADSNRNLAPFGPGTCIRLGLCSVSPAFAYLKIVSFIVSLTTLALPYDYRNPVFIPLRSPGIANKGQIPLLFRYQS